MYATAQDFVLRVGELQALQLTDRNATGEIDYEVLAIALSDSSSQIDGYLSARYKLPLSQVPQNLTRICCDLTRYRLCSMSDVTISDEIIERYKLSIKELEALASGKISLGITDESNDTIETTADSAVQFFNGNNRIFSRDNAN